MDIQQNEIFESYETRMDPESIVNSRPITPDSEYMAAQLVVMFLIFLISLSAIIFFIYKKIKK